MKPLARLSLAAVAVALALGVGYWAGSRHGLHPASGPTAVTPSAVTPSAVTPSAVTPSAVTPSAVTPSAVTPSAVAPSAVAPSAVAPPTAPAVVAPTVTAPAASGERKILYYRNPMGLPDTSPVPKKDPMGMDYIPVYADEAPDDSGVLRVSPARVQVLGVKTALAETRALDAPVRAVGRVEVNERAVFEVAPRFEGWIERLHVNAVGDPVRRGQALFTVYSPELQSADEELRIAERLQRDSADADPMAAAAAARLAEATRTRLRNWEVAPGAQRQTFHAPANGIVLEKNAVQGARFMPGQAIYRIADLSTVWVMADVFEQDLARVARGQRAAVSFDALPGRDFAARVAYVYPVLDTATRTTRVRLELDNRAGLLRPGMFAHVELAGDTSAPRITVPASAVIDDGHRQVVLLALGEGRFRPQPVKLGRRGRDDVEVLDGVQAGDRVVVSANFLIDSESQLRAALSNLGDADAGAATPAPPATPTFEADGVLEEIDAAAKSVTLTHGAIPALKWPEMTMDFSLGSPEVAAGIAPGTRVRFRFEQRAPGEFVVTRIERDDGTSK